MTPPPADAVDRAVDARKQSGSRSGFRSDSDSAAAAALGGIALCLFGLQFTLVGLLDGGSIVAVGAGALLGLAGVTRALRA